MLGDDASQHVVEIAPALGVQASCWFIENQYWGAGNQSRRALEPLQLTTRKVLDEGLGGKAKRLNEKFDGWSAAGVLTIRIQVIE